MKTMVLLVIFYVGGGGNALPFQDMETCVRAAIVLETRLGLLVDCVYIGPEE